LLGIRSRTDAIRKGLDADLLLVDGNPLQDISAACSPPRRDGAIPVLGDHHQRSE